MFLARTNFIMRAHLLSSSLLFACQAVFGAEPVRPMSTDRPDTTESGYTVPAGMFQVEMSFFDYSRDADAIQGTSSDIWLYGQVNLKAGLTRSTDLQVIVNSHAVAGESERGDRTSTTGFGDITVRLKQNLFGNDSGPAALALMPYITIPTHTKVSDESWAGGLIIPLSVTLTDRMVLGLMIEGDIVHDMDSNGYDLEWLHSATLGFSLTEKLGLYVELVGIAGQDAKYLGIFDAGLTFAVTDSLIFDAGVRIGMNRPAPDFGVFSGVSFRF
jgi:hypothetical protein